MRQSLEEMEDMLEDADSEALFLEPRATFDRAILGLATRADGLEVIAYDRDKVIDAMVEVDGMDYDEALEFFEFNTAGAYVGPGTPIFISRIAKE